MTLSISQCITEPLNDNKKKSMSLVIERNRLSVVRMSTSCTWNYKIERNNFKYTTTNIHVWYIYVCIYIAHGTFELRHIILSFVRALFVSFSSSKKKYMEPHPHWIHVYVLPSRTPRVSFSFSFSFTSFISLFQTLREFQNLKVPPCKKKGIFHCTFPWH